MILEVAKRILFRKIEQISEEIAKKKSGCLILGEWKMKGKYMLEPSGFGYKSSSTFCIFKWCAGIILANII